MGSTIDPSSSARGALAVRDTRARLDAPEVRSTLAANRAKLELLRGEMRRLTAAESDSLASPKREHGEGGGREAPTRKQALAETVQGRPRPIPNPAFDEDATRPSSSPPRKAGGAYAPRYVDAIRSTPSKMLGEDARLPPCGDLFGPSARDGGASEGHAIPVWDRERPYLTGEFVLKEADSPSASAAAYNADIGEREVLEELLDAFLGIPGDLLRCRLIRELGGQRLRYELVTRGRVESGVQEMVTRMLPVCECASVVRRFVETRSSPSWGRTSQALAGSLRALIQDWHLMVAQLESQLLAGKLSLQALWYFVQPPSAALHAAAVTCCQVSAGRLRGAALLDLLHARVAASLGDTHVRSLLRRLLKAATEPYFEALRAWLGQGVLDDPAGEFLVAEDRSVDRDNITPDGQSAFWRSRWVLREREGGPAEVGGDGGGRGAGPPAYEVPGFLAPLAPAILDAGKCLNVLQASGRRLPRTLDRTSPLEYDDAGRYAARIREACGRAGVACMDALRHDLGLECGLGVLKNYFLTARGDVLGRFLDAAESELALPAAGVPLPLLQGLLDSAVRDLGGGRSECRPDLRVAYDQRSLLNMLISVTQGSTGGAYGSPTRRTGAGGLSPPRRGVGARSRTVRESFMLQYDVPWPASIITPQAAISQYQMVFRHMIELRWVERELSRVWLLYQRTAPLACLRRRALQEAEAVRAFGATPREDPRRALAEGQATCQLASHFFRQTLLYLTFEVVEPLWRRLEERLSSAQAIDAVVAEHQAFLRRLLKGCLLSRKVVVLRALLALKDLALQFVHVSDRYLDTDARVEADEEGESQRRRSGPRAAHLARAERAACRQEALAASLDRPEYGATVADLRAKFTEKTREFMAQLAEARRAAAQDGIERKEELDGLSNLILRLDLYGFFGVESDGVAVRGA